VPDQPGLVGQTYPTDPHGHAAENADDDASVGEGSVASSLGDGSVKSPRGARGERKEVERKEVPRFARKWHAQEAVAPRDFSLGAYCLDTPPRSDKDR